MHFALESLVTELQQKNVNKGRLFRTTLQSNFAKLDEFFKLCEKTRRKFKKALYYLYVFLYGI